MKPIFVDASFWIALRDRHDPLHLRATQTARAIAGGRRALVTTHLVFAEIHAYFSRFKNLREQLINDFWSGNVVRLESVQPADNAEALALLRQHDDKSYSFCDAVSFVLMRRLGLQQALSFDGHFQQIGEFEIL